MNPRIVDVVLFVSTQLESCHKPWDYVKRNNMDFVRIARIDTHEQWRRARTGRLVQIKSTPSLVIKYDPFDVQVVDKAEEVFKLIEQLYSLTSGEPEKEKKSKKSNRKKKSKKSKRKKKPRPPSDDDEGIESDIFAEDDISGEDLFMEESAPRKQTSTMMDKVEEMKRQFQQNYPDNEMV